MMSQQKELNTMRVGFGGGKPQGGPPQGKTKGEESSRLGAQSPPSYQELREAWQQTGSITGVKRRCKTSHASIVKQRAKYQEEYGRDLFS